MVEEKVRILVINPGSTSTKLAVCDNETAVFEASLQHDAKELAQFQRISDQFDFRLNAITSSLDRGGVTLESIDVIAARGGLLYPLEGGTYMVSDLMVKDLREGVNGQHASNLGGLIGKTLADQYQIPAFIVDPVIVDEMDAVARISGSALFPRKSVFHALNQKAVAREVATDLGEPYQKLNLIVAHLGGGVSVGAHMQGRVLDVNNALDGEGAFSPERAGSVDIGAVIDACFSGEYTKESIKKKLVGEGGLVSYFGTSDCRKVEQMMQAGDEKASLIFSAMAYQIAKEIGAASTVFAGNVDAIIFTGGLAWSKPLIAQIEERIGFIAPVIVRPGEYEMEALAAGVLRVMRGTEEALEYQGQLINESE